MINPIAALVLFRNLFDFSMAGTNFFNDTKMTLSERCVISFVQIAEKKFFIK